MRREPGGLILRLLQLGASALPAQASASARDGGGRSEVLSVSSSDQRGGDASPRFGSDNGIDPEVLEEVAKEGGVRAAAAAEPTSSGAAAAGSSAHGSSEAELTDSGAAADGSAAAAPTAAEVNHDREQGEHGAVEVNDVPRGEERKGPRKLRGARGTRQRRQQQCPRAAGTCGSGAYEGRETELTDGGTEAGVSGSAAAAQADTRRRGLLAGNGGTQHWAPEVKDAQDGKARWRRQQEAGEETRGQVAEAEDESGTGQARDVHGQCGRRSGLPQAAAGEEASRCQLAVRRGRKRPRNCSWSHASWGDDEEQLPSGDAPSSRDFAAPASPQLLPSPAGHTPALFHRQVNGGDCCWRALAAAITHAEGQQGYCYRPNVEGPYRAGPTWTEVKDRVIVHMLRNSSRYAAWFSGRMPTRAGEPGDWNEYLRKLTEPRSWGSDLEVAAAACEYGCPIVIFGGDKEYQVFHKRGWRAPLVLYYRRRHFSWMAGKLSRAFLREAEERPPRHWRGGTHEHRLYKRSITAHDRPCWEMKGFGKSVSKGT